MNDHSESGIIFWRGFSHISKSPHQKEGLHKCVICFLGELTEALKFFKMNL